jgi:hypothetical protein
MKTGNVELCILIHINFGFKEKEVFGEEPGLIFLKKKPIDGVSLIETEGRKGDIKP